MSTKNVVFGSLLCIYLILLVLYIFFLSGFFFTDTDDTQGSRGREWTIFYSTLPLPPAHEHQTFSTLHKRWQSHIFNHTACIYRSATRWDLPPYRITTIFSPPLLFRSSLNDVQKPCIKSWEEEKQSSSFVLVIIKISVYSVNIYLSKSNLFLLEFMFT